MRVAVEAGWVRARATCLAADAVSLLAAVVLYIFSIGVVKGFAFALGISTVIDLVVFFLFTKPMVSWLATFQLLLLRQQVVGAVPGPRRHESRSHRRPRVPRPLEVTPDEQAVEPRTLPLRGQGLHRLHRSQVALVLHLRRSSCCWRSTGCSGKGLNLGIEFEGGVEYRVSMKSGEATQANVEKIRDAVAQTALGRRHPGRRVADREHLRLGQHPRSRPSRSTTTRPPRSSRRSGTRSASDRRISRDAIGATWGAQVANRALLGLVVFLVLVVLFIWAYFREWKMSVGAIVALVARPADHGRRLRAVRVRGHAGHGDRHPDHPGLLALRHRRGLRQGAREHQEPRAHPADLRRGREPGGQPDPGPVDQHLDRGAAAGRRAALRRRGVAGLGRPEGPRARAVRRHGGRRVLLDLHRHPARRTAQGARARDQGRGRAGACGTATARPSTRTPRSRRSPRTCRCRTSRGPTGRARATERGRRRERPGGVPVAPGARYTAGERPASRPVSPSASAKRAQPSRKPRSRRGKP